MAKSKDAPPAYYYVLVTAYKDGVSDYNLDLSRRRAASVMRELSSKQGIAADRLDSFGCGWYAPVASNDSEQGRAKNRRVELVAW